MKQFDTLFISPHLDDVVISCAARLMEERNAGRSSLIATLFTEAGQSSSVSNDVRKTEERSAMLILDVDCLWLGFTDSQWRLSCYDNFGVSVGETNSERYNLVQAVAMTINELFKTAKPDCIIFPLAIGEHIDHLLAFEANVLSPHNMNIEFFEDRPYCFVDGALEARLKQPKVSELFLEAKYVMADRAEFEQIVEGVSAYDSQIGRLFGTIPNYRAESKVYSAKLGGSAVYIERFWKVRNR